MTPEIKENLSVQLSELETLQSVYPKEVHICDQGNLADINEIVSGTSDEIPQNLEYIINLSVLEVYPNIHFLYKKQFVFLLSFLSRK